MTFNSGLIKAFPSKARGDAEQLISHLPEPSIGSYSYTVEVCGETVEIPYRIYHDLSSLHLDNITSNQFDLWNYLQTRHHSGFVREESLRKIIDRDHDWIPPFTIQLAGEYIAEIIGVIRDKVEHLNPDVYRDFLVTNPRFYATTRQRIISYWNCYYRDLPKEDYPGFQVMEFFDRLL
jgi:hypothetical protein